MRITANQVTIARIFCLPFPCWALIARPPDPVMWVAFVFGVLVGATDFVDGWLARRHGGTTLGALLDPVADKLFIAMLLVPTVAHGECPGWAAGALFVRELLITSLRSSMAVRKQSLKTSQLGKLKTVVQMGGIAVFFLTLFTPPTVMPTVHLAITIGWALLAAGWWLKTRHIPLWLIFAPILWGVIWGASLVFSPEQVAFWIFILMVLFTWVSGADYLVGAWRALRATGGINFHDVARIVWSVAHGVALIPLLDERPELVVPVIVSLCAELSLGGVENLVAAERGAWAKGSVLPTAIAALVVGAAATFNLLPTSTLLVLAWGLAALSIGNLARALWLDREMFRAHALSSQSL